MISILSLKLITKARISSVRDWIFIPVSSLQPIALGALGRRFEFLAPSVIERFHNLSFIGNWERVTLGVTRLLQYPLMLELGGASSYPFIKKDSPKFGPIAFIFNHYFSRTYLITLCLVWKCNRFENIFCFSCILYRNYRKLS